MKRFFLSLGAVAVMGMLALSCDKNGGQGGDEPGPGPEPAAKELYVSPEGAGLKDGSSAENALSFANCKAQLLLAMMGSLPEEPKVPEVDAPSSAEEPEGPEVPVLPVYENIDLIDGYTFIFADGTYNTPDDDDDVDGLEIAFPGLDKQVELTFMGSDKAILSGQDRARVLTIGDQVKLTIDGMTVATGNRKASGGGIRAGADGEGAKCDLVLKETVFDNNKVEPVDPKCSGGAIGCYNATVVADGCVFGSGNYGRNGGGIYTEHENADVTMKDCTFRSHTYNTGGAANNSKGTQRYENCSFDGCYTEYGTGGAIHANAAGAVVTIKDCVFQNCRAFVTELDKDVPNDNKASGIISMQAAEVTIEGCTFDNCYSSAGAVILVQKSKDAFLKCSDTVFKNNKGRSRGLVQLTNEGEVAFFNNCVFYMNEMVTGAWGLVLHGANPSVACFHNCTVYGNTRGAYTNQSVAFNTDGSILFTNSTYIGKDGLASIRANTANNATVLLANSILINEGVTVGEAEVKDFVNINALKAPFNAYNSILGGTYSAPETGFSLNQCISDATPALLAGGAYDEAKNVYAWNGPEASAFEKMTPTGFETAVKGITLNNGNTRVNGEVGPAFYAWLQEIGALGKDALGNDRGAAWWPGAYQK